jgi:2-iminobutanoate/2-iminopropanoate deaminase
MRPTHREEIRVAGMPEPISHFTHVVRAGRTVFVSGCVASDENGKTVGGTDIVAQTRQVHENIKRCLAAAGATFADVCKVTVFLKNVGDREKVNSVRKEYFGAHRPASTLIEISRLVRDDLLIEIEAIAVLPEHAERGRSPSGSPRGSTAPRLRTATPGSRAPLQKSPRHAPPKKRR